MFDVTIHRFVDKGVLKAVINIAFKFIERPSANPNGMGKFSHSILAVTFANILLGTSCGISHLTDQAYEA